VVLDACKCKPLYVPSGGWHFLAYRDEQLVSHALVTTHWLQPEGESVLKTAYVDAVATLPTYRGQGYGSALMRQLASEIEHEYVIACLETERPAFYAQLGWELWRGPLLVKTISSMCHLSPGRRRRRRS
jgi:aminoglycoside 2'-N-acetyltransferase I